MTRRLLILIVAGPLLLASGCRDHNEIIVVDAAPSDARPDATDAPGEAGTGGAGGAGGNRVDGGTGGGGTAGDTGGL